MPIVYVEIDEAARQAYLAVYQQQAIARVDAHARAIWAQYLTVEPWLEMVYLHRAVQGYAYLNDPAAEDHLDRYPVVASGVPSYGATRPEVAAAYVQHSNQISVTIAGVYEAHRHTVNAIPGQLDKPQIDALVNGFIGGNPLPTTA